MTEDQMQRLRALSEKVADAVLIDADPSNWSGYQVAPKDMDKETRGNARWDRGIASQSLAVLVKLVQVSQHHDGRTDPDDDAQDMSPHEAEAAAVALLDRVQARRGR
jgi:hypothetical protein